MLKLKMILISLILISNTVYADSQSDCQSKCKVIINAADKVIQDLKDEISVRKQLEAKQSEEIDNVLVMYNENREALASPLRNPIFMVLVGVVIGGAAIVYLKR